MGFLSSLFGGGKREENVPDKDPWTTAFEAIRNGEKAQLAPYQILIHEFPLAEQTKDLDGIEASYYIDYYQEMELGEYGRRGRMLDEAGYEELKEEFRSHLAEIGDYRGFTGYFEGLYEQVSKFVQELDLLSESSKTDAEIYMTVAADNITAMIHGYSNDRILHWLSARFREEGMAYTDRVAAVSRIGEVQDRINEEKLRLLNGDLSDSKAVSDKLYLSAISTALGAAEEPNATRYLARNRVAYGCEFADYYYSKYIDFDDSFEKMIALLYKGIRTIRRKAADQLPEKYRGQ